MATYTIRPRWKEELVCTSSEGGELVFDDTMGVERVYFPSESAWARWAPPWAKGEREVVLEAVKRWCGEPPGEAIPLQITDDYR